ncbi:MAG: YggS family pyridoxal phosphate-dependent enzyme [Kiritimatiellae bacterium]|nr:YggS family pyridoxal phosphate-dependent enzyme [Kiritimatiellia bacterium]
MSFIENLEAVEQRIAAACARCGRSSDSVNLLAVGKKHAPEVIQDAVDAGVTVIGENRIQEARQKIPLCSSLLDWHLIGHLQSNKTILAVEMFTMIHSVDSLRLLEKIDSACGDVGKSMPVCLQVNVSGEGSKSGLKPDDVLSVLEGAGALYNVDIVGLMTIPPFTEEVEDARPHFVALRELRDQLREDSGFELPELSMGMSRDFEVAIEEGATWVRIGSILFGKR